MIFHIFLSYEFFSMKLRLDPRLPRRSIENAQQAQPSCRPRWECGRCHVDRQRALKALPALDVRLPSPQPPIIRILPPPPLPNPTFHVHTFHSSARPLVTLSSAIGLFASTHWASLPLLQHLPRSISPPYSAHHIFTATSPSHLLLLTECWSLSLLLYLPSSYCFGPSASHHRRRPS